MARRNSNTDIRLIIAGAYLGLGTVWHGGLSGSAPLILATPGNPLLAPATGAPIVERLYPVTETRFIPFNLVYLLVVGSAALGTLVLLHPNRDVRKLSLEQAEAILPKPPPDEPAANSPAARIDAFRGWVDEQRVAACRGDAFEQPAQPRAEARVLHHAEDPGIEGELQDQPPRRVDALTARAQERKLIQPMWAIPVLAVIRMRFGDIVGYTFLVALACLAVSVVAMLVIPAAL